MSQSHRRTCGRCSIRPTILHGGSHLGNIWSCQSINYPYLAPDAETRDPIFNVLVGRVLVVTDKSPTPTRPQTCTQSLSRESVNLFSTNTTISRSDMHSDDCSYIPSFLFSYFLLSATSHTGTHTNIESSHAWTEEGVLVDTTDSSALIRLHPGASPPLLKLVVPVTDRSRLW